MIFKSLINKFNKTFLNESKFDSLGYDLRIVTLVAVTFGLFSIPYFFVAVWLGFWLPAGVAGSFIAGMVTVLILNHYDRPLLTRMILLFLADVSIIAFGFFFGVSAHVHWLLMALVITPNLFFIASDRKTLACFIVGLAIPSAGIFLIEYISPVGTYTVSAEVLSGFRYLSIFTLIGLTILQQIYWSLMNKGTGYLITTSRQRLQIAMDTVGFGIWDWDTENRKLIWDDSMYKVFGLERSQFSGNSSDIEKFIAPNDVKRLRTELTTAFVRRTDFQSDFGILLGDRPIRTIRTKAKCFYGDNGKIYRAVGACWDITDIMQNEMKLVHASKMSALGQMAGNISHEINTPLTTIQLSAEVIERKIATDYPGREDLTKLLGTIQKTVIRISRIISGLRTFARDGKYDEVETVLLKQIIEETLDLCRLRFVGHQIDLQLTECDAKIAISCRSTQISQALVNILNNSFDAVVNLEVRKVWVDAKKLGARVEIGINDSGPRIPLETQLRMKEPFFTTKGSGKGTGLGLSISTDIIEGHGGSIELDNNSPNTRFVISLPSV